LLLTAGDAVVTKVYVPSGLGRSGTCLAHSKWPSVVTVVTTSVITEEVEVEEYVVSDETVVAVSDSAPSFGLHLPCTSSPLAVVLITNSSSAS